MNEAPDWTLCRSLLGVLRGGSLSAAARSLGLTQPTLARHIEQIESALGGAKLFTRSPQGLAPTEAALLLKPHAEAMESAAAAMVRAVSGPTQQLAGAVRITASDIIGAEVLPLILRDLRAKHPGLVFEVQLSNQNVDLLRRDADIAVRMVQPKQEALAARRIGDIPLGLHAHPDYLARAGVPRSLEEIRDSHALIGFDRVTAFVDLLAGHGLKLSRDMFAYRTDNDLAQLSAIRSAFGIGVCQTGLALRTPRLTRVLADAFSVPLGVWVVMHEDLRGLARVRAVFDHLVAGLGEYVRQCGDR
jgi:DNA-binding transcriptional LysR family regulator